MGIGPYTHIHRQHHTEHTHTDTHAIHAVLVPIKLGHLPQQMAQVRMVSVMKADHETYESTSHRRTSLDITPLDIMPLDIAPPTDHRPARTYSYAELRTL